MSLERACAEPEECGVRVKEETDQLPEHSLEIKAEWEEEIDSLQQNVVLKKKDVSAEELAWSLKSEVKEESELLDLYAGHTVEGDLVLGPEGPQLSDSAFIQPTSASSPLPSRVVPVSLGLAADGQSRETQKPGQEIPWETPYSCNRTQNSKKTREQILEAKKKASRERYRKLKSDPEKYKEHYMKQKKNYKKRYIKIDERTAQEQAVQREKWRLRSSKYYFKKRTSSSELNSPGEDSDSYSMILYI